jgi:SRSO17 transposase
MAKKTEVIETTVALSLSPEEITGLVGELKAYHAIYAPLFAREEQRQWASVYLQGLVSPSVEGKSVEPMVLAIHGADGNAVRAVQQFVGAGAWDDEAILQRHWAEVNVTLGEEDGVLTLDGSDFPKQGQHSVGVKRQHCGQLGKRANCQAGVFLGYVSSQGYTLLDRRLYLPEEWVHSEDYAERRRTCGVPADITFRTKNELAWEMIASLHRAESLSHRWVACDEAFGRDTLLLDRIAGLGLWYFAEVPQDTRVWAERPVTEVPAWSGRGRKPERPQLVPGQPQAQLVSELARSFSGEEWTRRCIKEGSKGPIVADFLALRVTAVRDGLPGPEVWLVLRRSIETGEIKYFLCNAPAETALSTLVRIAGLRWPIETCFEEGKQYLGMGDYEVRSWRGWHHHMTLCILAHHFLVRAQHHLKQVLGLTLPQVRLLLAAVLPRPQFDVHWVLGVIAYRRVRNAAAHESHRRGRLERLRTNPGRADQGSLEVSL